MERVLAVVCRCCPLCIVRRWKPRSLYGRIMARVERGCPFCRAYDRRQARLAEEKGTA
jgi:hypothetical protein